MFAMQNAAVAYYFKDCPGQADNVQLCNVIGTLCALHMSCALFLCFYLIDAKTTDLMKKDLAARRAQL